MGYRLYLDDLRDPKTPGEWIVARSMQDALSIIELQGMPDYISFDHDLGEDADGTGYDFAKQLIDLCLTGKATFPDGFEFNVHSANPVGAANITAVLNHYLTWRDSNGS